MLENTWYGGVPPVTTNDAGEPENTMVDAGTIASVGEDISSADYAKLLNDIPALAPPVREALEGSDDRESPAMVASAVELVLEGLHLSKRLNKEASGAKASYRARS